MIHTEDGEFLCECDDCGTEMAGGTCEKFLDFVSMLKREDWHIVKVDDSYEHYCPECWLERIE